MFYIGYRSGTYPALIFELIFVSIWQVAVGSMFIGSFLNGFQVGKAGTLSGQAQSGEFGGLGWCQIGM